MSVWDEPSYDTDAVCALLKMITMADLEHPVVTAAAQVRIPDDVLIKDQIPAGILSDVFRDHPRYAKIIEPEAFRKKVGNIYETLEYFKDTDLKFGLNACYILVNEAYEGNMKWPKELKERWRTQFTKRMYHTSTYPCYISKRDSLQLMDQIDKEGTYWKHMLKYENFAEGFNHILYVNKAQSYAKLIRMAEIAGDPMPACPTSLLDFGTGWKVFRVGSMAILEHSTYAKRRAFFLTQKDIRRITQMFYSMSDMELYFGVYDRQDSTRSLYPAYRRVLKILMHALGKEHRWNEIARAADVAAGFLLAHIANDIWDKSILEHEKKIQRENLDDVLDIKKLLSEFTRVPLAEGIELSKVYKFLPCPDFNIFDSVIAQRDKHSEVNAFAEEEIEGVSVEDFKLYARYQLIRTFHAVHGIMPGSIRKDAPNRPWMEKYPHILPSEMGYKDSELIDIAGRFRYDAYTNLENPTLKDRTLAPDRVNHLKDETDLIAVGEERRNYLLSYLANPSPPVPEDVRQDLTEGSNRFDLTHLIAFKPESKKPIPRNFYMANYPVRVALSEFEENLAYYLKKKAGSFSGIGATEAWNKMNDLCGDELEHARNEYVTISFDIAGWSPRQNPRLRKIGLEKWAEAFGVPDIMSLDKIFSNGKVSYIKKGFHMQYGLKGNDLEGFLGRLNTDLHIDIMGYAIRKLREKNVLGRGAKLAVLIDDGACAIQFPRETAKDMIVEGLNFIEKVYRYFGLEISWDKTYASKKFYIFLNELFYEGIRITPGIKAFLRIRDTGDTGVGCFLRQSNKVGAMVQGAVRAGTPIHLAYFKYCWEMGRLIGKWKGSIQMNADEAVLLAFTPISYGGLGVYTHMSFLGNVEDEATGAALGHIKSIAHHDKLFCEHINKMINRDIAVRRPLDLLRAPTSYSISDPTLTDTKEIHHAEKALRLKAKNFVVLDALSVTTEDLEKWVVDTVSEWSGLRLETLEMMYNACPLAFVDGILSKFKRARTVLALLGWKKGVVLYKAYQREFKDVVAATLSAMK